MLAFTKILLVAIGLTLPAAVWQGVLQSRTGEVPTNPSLPILVPLIVATVALTIAACAYSRALCTTSRESFRGLWQFRWWTDHRRRLQALPAGIDTPLLTDPLPRGRAATPAAVLLEV